MSDLTLYAAPMSSATPVACAIAELGVPCRTVMLDLAAGDQKKPEYLAINPHGVVPTLVVDGTPLFESVAIMQWLGGRYGVERGLWPAADTPERLTALSWTTWAYVSYGMLINVLNFSRSPHADAAWHHPPLAEEALRRLDAALERLDAELAGRPWLLGEAYSLADLIVACVITYSAYCGVPLERHGHVRGWLRRFYQRPAYLQTWGAVPPMV
ncbi:glutathione S-transferase family protein [Vulcaniibacterium tengchongense]|uniref:GST-like protein n=1 Tax=Vulcaniibacterium tengchongense TaxID=1273429 RepID=A0A3N4VJB6_9GAMM|nr:glutathione S-transferase family protein [Vulcaniibacterium tengchongense]RPE77137.1 GST-like protein [Vulcaniibacterium tengchongense]